MSLKYNYIITLSGMKPIYDPIEFINKGNIMTVAIIGSFITYKLFNCMYINLYEPIIDTVIDTDKTNQYYLPIGKYHVQLDTIFKEFIKWIFIIILLMIFYNVIIKKNKKIL